LKDDLNDSLGALVAMVLINFGFCGLSFFEENLKLHKALIDSQLQSLKAQINPHFMFNVLNHVNVLIKKEPDLASNLLVQYTGILRYQLYSGEKDLISIRQEVAFLKDFIDIEKVRWKNSLNVQCSWEIEDEETLCPPLLFITFIENAFKHVSRSKTEKGYVTISLKQQGREVRMYVENSKFADASDRAKSDSAGLGLENIKRRLDILYPAKYELNINQSDTVYSTTLKIQLQR
jgi:LytS/YehU family sensor histidine kinase